MRTLGLVETERHTATGIAHPQRFCRSSVTDPDPAAYAQLVWQHWPIENPLHRQPDMTFGEDQCRLRTANAALTATALRKMAPYWLS